MLADKLASLGTKRYFSVKEVVAFCDEDASVLRYWEHEFKQLRPQKVQNQRRYQKKDIQIILLIKHLLRDESMSIDKAKKQLINYQHKLKNTLNKTPQKSYLVDVKQELRRILSVL